MIFGLGWNWTDAKNCFLPRLKIESRPKIVFYLGWNWASAKNCFMPRLKFEPRPKGSLGFKNRESLFFFFFPACAFFLSATHLRCCCCAPTTRDIWCFAYSCFDLAKCDLGLANWAWVCCVAGAWQNGVVCGWRSVIDGGEMCRWR